MKTSLALIVIFVALSTICFFAGCAQKAQIFGEQISQTKITPIKDILANPAQFISKTVLLEGKIVSECPAGGWFMLKDESGIIYVNLHPSNFAIPQVVGRNVLAHGAVKKEYTQVSIVGKGVQLK